MIKRNKLTKYEAEEGRVIWVRKPTANVSKQLALIIEKGQEAAENNDAASSYDDPEVMVAMCYVFMDAIRNEDGSRPEEFNEFSAEELAEEIAFDEFLTLSSALGAAQAVSTTPPGK